MQRTQKESTTEIGNIRILIYDFPTLEKLTEANSY